MNYIVEITEDKFSELTENAEKMLRYGGKVSPVSTLSSVSAMASAVLCPTIAAPTTATSVTNQNVTTIPTIAVHANVATMIINV